MKKQIRKKCKLSEENKTYRFLTRGQIQNFWYEAYIKCSEINKDKHFQRKLWCKIKDKYLKQTFYVPSLWTFANVTVSITILANPILWILPVWVFNAIFVENAYAFRTMFCWFWGFLWTCPTSKFLHVCILFFTQK